MKVAYDDWKKYRRSLLSVHMAAIAEYEARSSSGPQAPAGETAAPCGSREADAAKQPPHCGARPLGGAVDSRPRDPEHWEAIRQMCLALTRARAGRWQWVGPRRLAILSREESEAVARSG